MKSWPLPKPSWRSTTCIGVDFYDWLFDAAGKHRHGFIRTVFDSGRAKVSPDIQDEPDIVNRPIPIKHDLRGYFSAPIRDAAFKYGIVSFFKREEGLFTAFEIVRFTRAGNLIAALVAKVREEAQQK